MAVRSLGLALFAAWMWVLPAAAQTTYELTAPELNRTSTATLSDRELRVVDQMGRESLYLREPRADSSDGAFIAYSNRAAGQIIRWPVSGSGPMQIGTVFGSTIEYRPSQMRVVARAAVNPPGAFGAGGGAGTPLGGATSDLFAQVWQRRQPQPRMLRLATRDDRGREWVLGSEGASRLMMFPASDAGQSDWYVVPAASGYVRVQRIVGGEWLALTAGASRTLHLERAGQNAGQLWRVVQSNNVPGGYWLESAIVSGVALTGSAAGVVSLLPIGASPAQVWWPLPAPVAPSFEPLWRTVSQEVRANPPLPPAQIDVLNSHTSPLLILIGDRRSSRTQQLRIEPGSQVTVPFDRDAGATIIETYEIRGPSGVWDRQQFATPIPPAPIYDLSVYEEFLQSIAIDRTGTSPNPIEDINYQPRSIGWVPLPAGTALPERGQFDAFAEARSANNPGAVRRFDPRSLEKPRTTPDPLESILREVAPPRTPPPPPAPVPTPTRQRF